MGIIPIFKVMEFCSSLSVPDTVAAQFKFFRIQQKFIFSALLLIAFAVQPAFSQKIYWVDRNADEIHRANLDGSNAGLFYDVTIAGSNDPLSIAIDKINNYLYWTDLGGSEVYYGRLSGTTLSFGTVVFDVSSAVGSPTGIDLDPIDGKVYFANVYEGGLDRMDLDGTNHALSYVGATGGTGDYRVAVDHSGGKLYWTELASVHRANLSDGGSEETIVGPLTALTIDVAIDEINGKLYYLQVAGGTGLIQQANLDGSNDITIIPGLSDQLLSIDIDPANGKVYWSEGGAVPQISRANIDGTVQEVIIPLAAGADPTSIALDTRSQVPPKIYWTENVGTGMSTDDEIHRVGFDGSDFEVVYSGFSAEISGVEIDEANNMIYWTDAARAEIFKGVIGEHETGLNKIIDHDPDASNGLYDLALDVAQNHLYYTHWYRNSIPSIDIKRIGRANLDGSGDMDINLSIPLGNAEPFGIDLDLTNGKMYYTTNEDPSTTNSARLWRANLDGTGVEMLHELITGGVGAKFYFRDVKVDETNQIVYWSGGPIDANGFIYSNDINDPVPFASPGSFTFPGEPRGIDLDLINNKIFWVCRGANVGANPVMIMKSDFDGNVASREIIHTVFKFPPGYPGTSPPGSAFMALDLRGLGAPPLALNSTTAAKNETNVSVASDLTFTFDQAVAASSVNSTNIIVRGEQTGIINGAFSGGGTSTITFNPTSDFKSGEVIRVTLTNGLQSTGGGNLVGSESYQFTTATSAAPETPPFFMERVISGAVSGTFAVFPADIDGDGDMDAVGTASGSNGVLWFENDGNQNFTERAVANTTSGPTGVYASDLDSDGDMDILVASQSDARVVWFDNDGSQNFIEKNISTTAGTPANIYTVDIDGDGDVDAISTSYAPSSGSAPNARLNYYINDGSENFMQFNLTNVNGTGAYPIDVDGDGDIDIVGVAEVAALSGTLIDKVAWYENDGAQNFTERIVVTPPPSRPVDTYATDMDGDGDVDILVAALINSLGWYENDGNQNFTEHEIGSSESQPREIYATDIDGDGDMDVISAHELLDEVALWINDGSQNFTRQSVTTSADLVFDVYAADMDSDGDIDILSASRFGNEISWYENTASTCSTLPTVNAGIDQSICPGVSITLAGSIGGSATGATWTSSGTGSFDNATLLTATYTPSAADQSSGSVALTLTVAAMGVCPQVNDQLILTIAPSITAAALNVATVLEVPVTLDVITPSTINAGDVITVAVTNQGTGGVATVNVDNTITYTPNTGFLGSDTFEYQITNQCGSVGTDFITITVSATPAPTSIIIYNGISPNSDNLNPYFRIENIETLEPLNKVLIYNRWGDKVFEVENYDNADATKRFNGTSDGGNDLPSGVYFYKIEFGSGSPELTGYLTLKR